MTKASRSEVIEAVAYKAFAYTEYPSSAEYNAICQALVTKYPTMKESTGNGYVSVIEFILCTVRLDFYVY